MGFIDEVFYYIDLFINYNLNNEFFYYLKVFIFYVKDLDVEKVKRCLFKEFWKDIIWLDIL